MAPPAARELAKIADQFQPKLLMFRLRRLRSINVTQSQKTQPNKFSTYPLARNLLATFEDEPGIVAAITPLLEAQVCEILERQMRDPYRVILESIWSPSHTSKEIQIFRSDRQDKRCAALSWGDERPKLVASRVEA